jgi:hypothetical protein
MVVSTSSRPPRPRRSSSGRQRNIIVSSTLSREPRHPVESIEAPNGTVYITSALRTAGVDSLPTAARAGSWCNAARVVITSSIDTWSRHHDGRGGQRRDGDVGIIATQGPIFFTSGSINTAGGSATDTGANPHQGRQGRLRPPELGGRPELGLCLRLRDDFRGAVTERRDADRGAGNNVIVRL